MTKNLTEGNPLRLILAFSLPVLLGNLLQQFYNMADTSIVGLYLGSNAPLLPLALPSLHLTVRTWGPIKLTELKRGCGRVLL